MNKKTAPATTFGHKLRTLRIARGLSEPEMAILLQEPYFDYMKLELNIIQPSEGMVKRIAGVYKISIEELGG